MNMSNNYHNNLLEVIKLVRRYEDEIKIIGRFSTITYIIPRNVHVKVLKTGLTTMYFCKICGGYCNSSDSISRRIFCTCSDVFGNKCRQKHRDNLTKVLDQLIFTKYSDISVESKSLNCFLECSRYYHEGKCVPDPRRCGNCWRYWCMTCGSGIGGMLGKCNYKGCRNGRRNCGLEY